MKTLKIAILVYLVSVLLGCTTIVDAIEAKGTGEFRVYESSKEEVWPIVVGSIEKVGLDLVSENYESGMVLAQRGVTVFSYGENVAVFVDEVEDNKCRVEIVSKKQMETNVFAPNWSNNIFRQLNSELN